MRMLDRQPRGQHLPLCELVRLSNTGLLALSVDRQGFCKSEDSLCGNTINRGRFVLKYGAWDQRGAWSLY
jgi:hypothetical protein